MPIRSATRFGTIERRVLLIDNYDSFSFNVVQQLARLGRDQGIGVEVVRNDACSIEEVLGSKPLAIVISPGPGGPGAGGISDGILSILPHSMPLLGVCLGHQMIAHHFGATVRESGAPMHGRTSAIRHSETGLFAGVPTPFLAARYHSLIVESATVPATVEITATSDDGTVMALQHRTRPIFGVQFHPESFLTEHGDRIIANFLALSAASTGAV